MKTADELLVQKAQAGDHKAFEVLVRKYQGKVAALIARYISDNGKIQDLTQEAFIKAYRALGGFRGESAFYSWLYRIAINTAKNELTLTQSHIPMVELDLDNIEMGLPQFQDDNTPERQIMNKELSFYLSKALDSLSPVMKQAVMLRDVQGISYEEISAVMGCPIGTVRSRIFRGRQEIMEQMNQYFNVSEK
ncbi:MAG: sigma-70 family RNA polymerase sigma factor [Magnetococcus sp. DMHC-6]